VGQKVAGGTNLWKYCNPDTVDVGDLTSAIGTTVNSGGDVRSDQYGPAQRR
jgi:hypothetical protein